MTVERYGLSLWGDENVLKWAVVMVSQLKKKKLCYYWLCWVFVAACRLCLVAVRRGCSLGVRTSHVVASLAMELGLVGISGCGSRAPGRGLSSCGTRAQLACGRWKPPNQGSNPRPLNWQVDSQSLDHQGSPTDFEYT